MEIWARHEWGVTTSIWVLGNHHVSLEYHFVCVEEICKSMIRAHFHIVSTDARRLPRTHMLEVIVIVKFGDFEAFPPSWGVHGGYLATFRWKRKLDISDPTMEIWARYKWGVTTDIWVSGNHYVSLEYHFVCVEEICKSVIIRAYFHIVSTDARRLPRTHMLEVIVDVKSGYFEALPPSRGVHEGYLATFWVQKKNIHQRSTNGNMISSWMRSHYKHMNHWAIITCHWKIIQYALKKFTNL